MTTPLVQSITQNGQNFSYTYDNVGNISSVTRNGLTTTYTYDLLGQLIRVNLIHMQIRLPYMIMTAVVTFCFIENTRIRRAS